MFNQLKPEWVKMPYIDGNSSAFINADEESNDIVLDFGDYAPWSFWMTLHNGYWDVETCFNDYMINYHINDIASEVYIVPLQCQLICRALGQQEAWICFDDRLNNSADAPSDDLKAWFRYAEKVGIKDVTYEDFKIARIMPGKERRDLIVYYCCPLKVSREKDIHPQCCCNGIADVFLKVSPLGEEKQFFRWRIGIRFRL